MRRTGLLLLLSLLTGISTAAEKAFRPGELWPDNNGVHINCHGGGMLVHGGTVYWFGQHMIECDAGNATPYCLHCQAATDGGRRLIEATMRRPPKAKAAPRTPRGANDEKRRRTDAAAPGDAEGSADRPEMVNQRGFSARKWRVAKAT